MKVLFKRHLKGCFHCYRNTVVRTQSLAMFQTLISIDNTVKMLQRVLLLFEIGLNSQNINTCSQDCWMHKFSVCK